MIEDVKPFITCLVVARNEEDYIDKCLQSLINQHYPKDRYEIIIVDGQSDDGTREIVKKYINRYSNIRLLDNPKRILASGWNIGIKEAKGKIVVRPDAHSYLDPNYLPISVETLEKIEGAVCVGGKLHSMNKGTFLSKAISYVLSSPFGVGNSKFRVSNRPEYVDTVAYGAYRKEIFNKVGYFNEELVRNEDLEMHSRIKKNGGEFYLNPEMKSYYYTRSNYFGLVKQAFRNGLWNILTLKWDKKALSFRHLVPFIFVSALIFNIIIGFNCEIGKYLLYIQLISYFAIGSIYAVKIGNDNGWRFIVISIILFLSLHISYGSGSLIGVIRLLFNFIRSKADIEKTITEGG